MLATISAIGGLVGLTISVMLLTWQTRAVAKQTQISNAIAGMNAIRDSTVDLREIYMAFWSTQNSAHTSMKANHAHSGANSAHAF